MLQPCGVLLLHREVEAVRRGVHRGIASASYLGSQNGIISAAKVPVSVLVSHVWRSGRNECAVQSCSAGDAGGQKYVAALRYAAGDGIDQRTIQKTCGGRACNTRTSCPAQA